MSLIRDIDKLEPATREKAAKAISILTVQNIPYFINETLRLRSTQGCYFLQGRVPLEVVNLFRQEAGLWPISQAENQRQITQTLKSKHLDGKAIDIVPMKDGGPWWSAPLAEFQKIASVMKSVGFEWGGDWKDFQDTPHYQVP